MYYGGGDSEFWRRHPLAKMLFCLALGAGFGYAITAMLRQGRFRLGGHRGELITREGDPMVFWAVIALAAIAGVAVASFGVWEFWRRRRRPA